MSKYLDCLNCGTMQNFRLLEPPEKAAVKVITQADYVDDYWRCEAARCLRFQRWYAKGDGGTLPEEFLAPAPDRT
ncbi:hypothetical protein [Streptomyces sp. SD15]